MSGFYENYDWEVLSHILLPHCYFVFFFLLDNILGRKRRTNDYISCGVKKNILNFIVKSLIVNKQDMSLDLFFVFSKMDKFVNKFLWPIKALGIFCPLNWTKKIMCWKWSFILIVVYYEGQCQLQDFNC